jgi:hypothetical protein
MEKQEREKVEELITECYSVRASSVSWNQVQRVAFVVAPKLADAAQRLMSEVDQGKQRIAELEKRLAKWHEKTGRDSADQCDRHLKEYEARIDDMKMQLGIALEERDNARGELAARLAMPMVDANGKTPARVACMAYKTRMHRLIGVGKVPRDDFDDLIGDEQDAWSECASAVLRVFGGEALRRTREAIVSTGVSESDAFLVRDKVLAIIDRELAKHDPTKMGPLACTCAAVTELRHSQDKVRWHEDQIRVIFGLPTGSEIRGAVYSKDGDPTSTYRDGTMDPIAVRRIEQPSTDTAAQPSVRETQKPTLRERFVDATDNEGHSIAWSRDASLRDLLRLCDLIDSR